MSLEEPSSSRSVVERALRRNIATGVWAPGDTVPSERDLARGLGVGRSTLRAAVDVLRAQGLLVTAIGRSGRTRVVDRGPQSVPLGSDARERILHCFELRSAVEPEAAALAARRGTTADFDRLRELLHEPAASAGALRAREARFSIATAAASGNPLMGTVVTDLHVECFTWADPAWHAVERRGRLPDARRAVDLRHKAIYDRLMNRDAAEARDEVSAHLESIRELWLDAVDNVR